MLHDWGRCFQNRKNDRRCHVPEKQLRDPWCTFEANTCLCGSFKHSTDDRLFFCNFLNKYSLGKEKDRIESSEEVYFFREKYMPLKWRKQIGFVAFGPDGEWAYNPWLSLPFTVCRLSSGISKPARKKSSGLFTGERSFAKTLFQLVVCSSLQHKCQR